MFWNRSKRRGKIVNLLVVTMLIVGTIPLVISGYNLISYNKGILTTDQQLLHLQICKSTADEISLFLQSCLNNVTPLVSTLELGSIRPTRRTSFTTAGRGNCSTRCSSPTTRS